jgi:hypothetical protein
MDKWVYRTSSVVQPRVQYRHVSLSFVSLELFFIIRWWLQDVHFFNLFNTFYRGFFTSKKYIAYRVKYLITGILLRHFFAERVQVKDSMDTSFTIELTSWS